MKVYSDKLNDIFYDNYQKVKDILYPLIRVLIYEKKTNINFSMENKLKIFNLGELIYEISILEFVKKTELYLNKIIKEKAQNSHSEIVELKKFLSIFSVSPAQLTSKLKNIICIKISDNEKYTGTSLGFSIKSQLGSPSTLLNASEPTNFTYKISGNILTNDQIEQIENERIFSKKIKLINSFGSNLEFEKVENEVFASNLQTIDFNFNKMLADIILFYYAKNESSENTIKKLAARLTQINPIGYNLKINPYIYEIIIKRFLTDYALGMRATEVWQRNYQATGGYLIVKDDGELICYHFYFMRNFEEYLFNNTKLETPSPEKHNFGKIYFENGQQKIKLNLQIRFIK